MQRVLLTILAAMPLALEACDSDVSANSSAPFDEGAQLNDATEMLDASPDGMILPPEAHPIDNGPVSNSP